MQGTLAEIDICSIFNLIKLGQRTGVLYIEPYSKSGFRKRVESNYDSVLGKKEELNSLYWFVFFVDGKIVYIADQSSPFLLRLQNYLQRYKVEEFFNSVKEIPIATVNDPEYAYLWLLLEKKMLTLEQVRNIVESMIEESLFELLSIHQASFIFEIGQPLSPQLVSLEISSLTKGIVQKIQQWKSFFPILSSPDQSFIIVNEAKLQTKLTPVAYKRLAYWADGRTSLRKISRCLDTDFLSLAKVIYPYVERGWINMIHPKGIPRANVRQNLEPQSTHIVCIDDDKIVEEKVKQVLESEGYKVTTIRDPLEALSRIFKLQPDLIICDITMPDLDGYQVCAMLRHSHAFKQTPIIMLTSNENFIDRVRAQMVGATDYLTKPFGDKELIYLIGKYIKRLSTSTIKQDNHKTQ